MDGREETRGRETERRALLSPAPRGFAARSRVLARRASLAQIGELARRLSVRVQRRQSFNANAQFKHENCRNKHFIEQLDFHHFPITKLIHLSVAFPGSRPQGTPGHLQNYVSNPLPPTQEQYFSRKATIVPFPSR